MSTDAKKEPQTKEKKPVPPEKERTFVYTLARIVACIGNHTIFPVRYYDRENFDLQGPYIAMSNHNSALDPLILAYPCRKYEFRFVGKKELTKNKFIGALLTAAQLGLEPNTPLGQAYLIPFKNYKKGGILECEFQLGYKGMIDLANRSGEIKVIDAHVVYENDDFECEFGLDPKLSHKPAFGDRGKPMWVYALYKTTNDGFAFEVMSVEEALAHGEKYSKAFNKSASPWQTEPEEI